MAWFEEQGIDNGYLRSRNEGGLAYADGIAGGNEGLTAYNDGGGSNGGGGLFGYTMGSLLQPWTKTFNYQGGTGGAVAEYNPFQYRDFSFRFRDPGDFTEQFATPEKFKFDRQFKAPTKEDLERDPGYAFRKAEGEKSLMSTKAAQGLLRHGGTMKSLMDYSQGLASQEYGNVYDRLSREYDRDYGQARDIYDLNFNTGLQSYEARRRGFDSNVSSASQMGNLGLNAAIAEYDRNYRNARTSWEDQMAHNQSLASAANASSADAYRRALQAYEEEKDNFWKNKEWQYGVLDNEANRGLRAAEGYATNMGNLYTGAANANAAGRVGSGNAWTGALGNIANNSVALAGYYATRGGNAGGSGRYSGGLVAGRDYWT